MKKITQFLILPFSFLIIGACNNKFEDEVFDSSATERVQKSVVELQKQLISSTEGWAFEYFPGGKEREAQGHMYVLKFTNTHVTAMLDTAKGTSSATTYAIKPNDGVTLSFDEYNPSLHHFAEPSGGAYNGQLADFEFSLVSKTDDVIVLKGKKYHSKMRLVKLTENAESYMNKVSQIRKYVGDKGLADFSINGEEIKYVLPKNIIFTYTENQQEKAIRTTYLYTDKGIRFYEPITINGVTFQDLKLNTDTNSLLSDDGKVVFGLLHDMPFNFSAAQWWYTIANNVDMSSDAFTKSFNEVKNVNDVRYSQLNISLSNDIFFDGQTKEIELFSRIKGSDRGFAARYELAFQGGRKPGEVNISLVKSGNNWNYFTHLNPFRDLIVKSSPYKAELDDQSNPTKVKLTSISNPEIWFVLNRL